MPQLTWTDKKRRFCEQYLEHTNATRAAIAAGYSERTAQQSGSRLLKDPEIVKYLNKHKLPPPGPTIPEIAAAIAPSAGDVIAKLTRIALGNIHDCYDPDTMQKYKLSELSGLEQKEVYFLKPQDQLKAIELLGKYYGIFERDNEQKNRPLEKMTQEELIVKIKEFEDRVRSAN